MDFLDFADNLCQDVVDQCAAGTISEDEATTQLLDQDDLLMELRSSAQLADFFAAHPQPLLAAVLRQDGDAGDGDETLEPRAEAPGDRRGRAACEVVCGVDDACRRAAAAVADDDACRDRLLAFLDDGAAPRALRGRGDAADAT